MPAGVPGATVTAPVAGFSVTFGLVVLTCVITTVASVAGTPLSVSLTSTFGTAVPPVAPLGTVPLSSTASITAAPTVTVAIATSQFVGFSVSQISYVTSYVPAGVPGATLTAPVAGFSVTPGSVVASCVIVTVASVAGLPFNVSLTSTFGMPTPPTAPFATVPVSSTASITAALTTIVAVAVSQFVGFNTSQIVYGYVYTPAVVPAATVIVPSAFIVMLPAVGAGAAPGVSVTVPPAPTVTGLPLRVSLVSTLGVLPPVAPTIGVAL